MSELLRHLHRLRAAPLHAWFIALALGGLPAPAPATGAAATPAAGAAKSAPAAPSASAPAATAAAAPRVTLPADIRWITNEEDPPIGSARAIRGGTLNTSIEAYPLTFRLVGPNSNDAFAGWNRRFTMNFTLVTQHPNTDRYIPWMATHWAIADDQRTLYFKLDRDARFSDGKPVTARDYVFTWRMMQSEHIVSPFHNSYAKRFFESVDAIDDYTLRIVGTRPSWRPLFDYAGLWPTPAHATVLDADWVKRSNNQFQIAPGPYVVSEAVRGQSITFSRVPKWWGDGKKRFQGLFNFDNIQLRQIPTERRLDWLRRGEIDLMQENTARTWNEEYTFPAVRNGWIRRARVFSSRPEGIYGLHMNLEAPIFKNKDFRKAVQHLFNFDRLNDNLMFGEYYRQTSFFAGTPYALESPWPYPFDPAKAREYLERAGYRRPAEIRAQTWWGQAGNAIRGLLFTRSDTDDVLVNDRGEKASFTLIYGSKGIERHLTVLQEEFRRAGIDMKLRLLEPGTAFERGLERKYEMTLTGRTTLLYPQPRQYLHTEFQQKKNNNNIWGYASPEVDALIAIYEEDLDENKRRQAMQRIDAIVRDEAFYLPFWRAPYTRVAYWAYVRFPDEWLPLRTEQLFDWMVFWIDPQLRAQLAEDMRNNKPWPLDKQLDKDHWGVMKQKAAP
ncbi:MAG TPA: extracellular solute-binding protein [Burkholderiaceae bacterium]|nr:extracellular solute-binding protein [Burkholderiaceae bacterium]